MVQSPIPKGADNIEPRFARRLVKREERLKGIMKYVLRLNVGQAECTPV
jgi:hypothetical protein